MLILLAGAAMILFGCEGRDRSNPLDPLNPDTGGVPDNLNAVAADAEVILEWDDFGFDDLEGYDIIRTEEDLPESTTLNGSRLSPSATTWVDRDVLNSRTYSYVLRFLTPGDNALLSEPDLATPGTVTIWAVDINSPSLRKISPDGRDLVKRIAGLSGPADLTITGEGGNIWVADYFGGQLKKYDLEGELILSRFHSSEGRGLPLSLDYRDSDSTIWVGARSPDGLSQVNSAGEEVSYYSTISYPIDVAIDGSDGTVWVASLDENTVHRQGPGDDGFTLITGFNQPRSLSVDAVSGHCWVADNQGVTILSRDGGTFLSLLDFNSPGAVAVDISDGSCWVSDYNGDWSVSRVDSNGAVEVRVGGFGSISDLAVDYSSGECWLTVVTATEGEVVKLSGDGEVLGKVGSLAYPSAIAVLP